MNDRQSRLARLPKMDQVLGAPALAELGWRRELKKRVVSDLLEELRSKLSAGEPIEVPDAESLAAIARAKIEDWSKPHPLAVINATGVLLHTNLGRAPLSENAVIAMAEAAGSCDLEIGLTDGRRGSRFVRLRPFLTALLGVEDVHVVNNNAAALLITCTVLGAAGGVALSRGQMVEIGDGFRVATMAGAGGCPVWAVGSTNRTHARDYEDAITGRLPEMNGRGASALLWVHLSNFLQEGFVHEATLPELAKLAKAHDVPLVADLGSGSLGAGLPDREPTIFQYIEMGADLVLASGDKLLSGPQAGIIAGRRDLVERCRRHPMARALRPDKTTLAALHATFVAHAADGPPQLPLHAMAGATVEELGARAQTIIGALGWKSSAVRATEATIGGGSLPGDMVKSVAIAVPSDQPSRDAKRLRLGDPPVVGRVSDGALLLDLRTVPPSADERLVAALRQLGHASKG